MRLFAAGHLVEVEVDAEVALGAHLDGGTGEARGAHVLDGDDGAGRHQLEAGFEQQLLREGVADLHGRALLVGGVVELGRGHGGAVDAVAAGLGAEIDDGQADALGLRIEDLVGFGDAGGEGVDEDVAVVAAVEIDLAADGRHAERIAVAADAGDDAGDEMAGLRVIGRAEAQRVQRRDRPRAHGEDVAQDAADAGRRALIGLDEGRVVVALHLEDHGQPVADVDDAGVLAGPADHPRAGGRQGPQPLLRRLVGAVLVPHGREDAELGQRRLAADQLEDALVFVGLQPVGGDEVGRDGGGGVHAGVQQPLEQRASVGAALERFDQVFRVGHHAEDVAALVEDAGDVVEPSRWGSLGVAEGDAVLALEARQGVVVAAVVAVAMGDGRADDLALARSGGEGVSVGLDA